jgi:NADPH:quinone reductase-like Zn-dependent oxidoreductase
LRAKARQALSSWLDRLQSQLAEDVARREFSIPIARVMKLQDIQEAHRVFEHGGLSGKIVLVP